MRAKGSLRSFGILLLPIFVAYVTVPYQNRVDAQKIKMSYFPVTFFGLLAWASLLAERAGADAWGVPEVPDWLEVPGPISPSFREPGVGVLFEVAGGWEGESVGDVELLVAEGESFWPIESLFSSREVLFLSREAPAWAEPGVRMGAVTRGDD